MDGEFDWNEFLFFVATALPWLIFKQTRDMGCGMLLFLFVIGVPVYINSLIYKYRMKKICEYYSRPENQDYLYNDVDDDE